MIFQLWCILDLVFVMVYLSKEPIIQAKIDAAEAGRRRYKDRGKWIMNINKTNYLNQNYVILFVMTPITIAICDDNT